MTARRAATAERRDDTATGTPSRSARTRSSTAATLAFWLLGSFALVVGCVTLALTRVREIEAARHARDRNAFAADALAPSSALDRPVLLAGPLESLAQVPEPFDHRNLRAYSPNTLHFASKSCDTDGHAGRRGEAELVQRAETAPRALAG